MSLSSQPRRKLLEILGILQSMVCRLLQERKNAILLLASINVGRKRMGKDEEIEISLKL
ncbi:hypothetical protein MXB_2496 [Myxobolus squamalis]|nr:hypothetical protein MXB_2496 [Myxobolus squamalis]